MNGSEWNRYFVANCRRLNRIPFGVVGTFPLRLEPGVDFLGKVEFNRRVEELHKT